MTITRRFPRRLAAGCVLLSGFATGCANSSQFTAGRLPYGGARTAAAEAPAQDPFATQAGAMSGQPTENAAGQRLRTGAIAQHMTGPGPTAATGPGQSAGFAPAAPPGAKPYETAYLTQPPATAPTAPSAENPFVQPTGQAEWGGFATDNPFAEIEGQPAIRQTAAQTASIPQITPAGGAADSWQPQAATAASYSREEFLPPRQ